MTYLSQFPKSKLAANAPLKSKADSKKARAFGKGVDGKDNKVIKITFRKTYFFLKNLMKKIFP